MTTTCETWVSADGSEVLNALEEAMAWCERMFVVAAAPGASEENAFWELLLREASPLGLVYVSQPAQADETLLQTLHGKGVLRVLPQQHGSRGNLLWFVRAGEVRVFLAGGSFEQDAWADHVPAWVRISGRKEHLPRGLAALLAEFETAAATPTAEELEQPLHPPAPVAVVYQREVRSVREVLAREDTRTADGFLSLEEAAQGLAVWSTLFGEGTLELEQAIRLSAHRLRAQGQLDYQALRQRGEIYQTIERCLLAARRSGELFDRPGRGRVRAIESNVDELSANDWRDCLMNSLREQHRVERSQAARLAFDYARAVYGLDAQRLRGGGRAERAIKSAINSAVRQGLLDRDGAMYLIRTAEFGEPILRGAIERTHSAPAETDTATIDSPHGDLSSVESPPTTDTEYEFDNQTSDVAFEPSTPPVLPSEAAQQSTPDATPGLLDRLRQEVYDPDHVPLLEALPRERPPAPPPASAPEQSPLPAVSVDTGKPNTLLDQRLTELAFPARTLNWASNYSVTTLGQLVAWDPESFANQRNVGTRTAQKTRQVLEEALGCTWEEAWSAHESKSPLQLPAPQNDEDAVTAGGALGWSAFGAALSEELRQLPLVELELPTRMRNFIQEEGLDNLGQLFSLSYNALRSQPNLGRKTLNDTLDALADGLAERANPVEHNSFMELWRAELAGLKPMHRLILSRRAGMHGPAETLEELGAMLGVSRERVRQIEARVVERLQEKSRWKRDIIRRLEQAFGGARAVSLELLDLEPWWTGIATNHRLFSFLLERVLGGQLYLFEAPSGALFVTKFAPDEFDDVRETIETRLRALDFPSPYAGVLEIVRQECSRLDLALLDELEACVREQLLFSDEQTVSGLGAGRSSEVLAFLGAQAAPVPVAVLEDKFGRGHLPAEVLYFKRGVVGLKKHFADFDAWMTRLVPLCVELMETLAPGRQWLVPELHDELVQRNVLPTWLGHWHLASLLRLSEQVEYLGRLRVALRGSTAERLLFEDLFLQLLKDAGEPLTSDELMRRAREQTDVRQVAADLMFKEAPFVRLDETRVGLVQRDIPGGPEAVAVAVASVTEHLAATQKGMTPFQVTQRVNQCSDTHATWTRQLVLSVLRNEPTVRVDRTKNIGLAEWDDVRCPARVEFIRREVAKHGGSVAVAVLNEQLAELYGRAPDRPALQGYVQQAGLSLKGDTVTRADAEPSLPPPVSGVALQLTGIPAELRELFVELTQQELVLPAQLEARIATHLEAFEREERVNEFVDADGARQLAAQSRALLARWETLPTADRHLAQAAIQYFVIIQDSANDFDIGGLDDDKRVMSAVLESIGLSGLSDRSDLTGTRNAAAAN